MTSPSSLIFGIHPLVELLKAKKRKIHHIYTTPSDVKALERIKKQIPAYIPITQISREELSRRAGTTDHQGIVALVAELPLRSKPFDPTKHPLILLLDGIQDPRNLGAIIRSAWCTGVGHIIIPHKQSAPLSGTVSKASAGLIEHVEIYRPVNSSIALQETKTAGYQIYLATIDGTDMRTLEYKTPLCLVIGSEGTGVSASLLKQGTKIGIPQTKPDISYNASVAAALLLFHLSSTLRRI